MSASTQSISRGRRDDQAPLAADRREFTGRFVRFTAGGGAVLSLRCGRPRSAPCMLSGRDWAKCQVYGDRIATDDPAIAAQLALAVKQGQEAYDEERRLG